MAVANVTVSAPLSNITVNSQSDVVTVSTSNTVVNVGETAQTSNATIRSAISATQSGIGSFSYSNSTGLMSYVGPSNVQVAQSLSNQAITTDSNITTTANVVGGFIHGDGSNLTSLPSISNAQAKAFIEANGLDATANLTTTANIQGGNIIGVINSNANIDTSGTLKSSGALGLAVTGNATIGGNLNVTGNVNSANVVDLFVEDRNITLQFGTTGTPSANSQIFVDRGSEANTFIIFREDTNKWGFSNDGANVVNFPLTSDDLAEGSTNKYFTLAGVNAAIDAKFANVTSNIVSPVNSSMQMGQITINPGPSGLAVNSELIFGNVANGDSNRILFRANSAAQPHQIQTVGTHLVRFVTGGNNSSTHFDLARTGAGSGPGHLRAGFAGDLKVEGEANIAGETTLNAALGSNSNITTTANVAGANFIGNVTGNVTGSPSSLAGLDTDDLSEGSSNLYFTTARSNTAFDARLATSNTSSLSEGTNLYFTTARANSAIGAYTGNLTGVSTTGNITTTANISGGNILGTVRGDIDTTSNITTTGNIFGGTLVNTEIQSNANILLTSANIIGTDPTTSFLVNTLISYRNSSTSANTNLDTSGNIGFRHDKGNLHVTHIKNGQLEANGAPKGTTSINMGSGSDDQITMIAGASKLEVKTAEIAANANITTTANISGGNILGTVRGEINTTSNITTTANVSAGNVLVGDIVIGNDEIIEVDAITSSGGANLTLTGQANGVHINKAITGIESRIVDIDTEGYAVKTADVGTNFDNVSMKSLLCQVTATAGANTATFSPLFGGAFGPTVFFGRQTDATTFTSSFGLGSSAEAALTDAPSPSGTGCGGNPNGWTMFVLADSSQTDALTISSHMVSISGNTATFSENFTKNVSAGGTGFSALLVPNAFSSTQELAMSFTTDTSNSQIPFQSLITRYSKYDLPETLGNVQLDRISYDTAGGASTVNLANVVTRNAPQFINNSGSGFRITDGSILIGNSLTPDVVTVGKDVLLPSPASLQGVASELDGKTTYTVDTAPMNKFNFNNFTDNSIPVLSAAAGNALPSWTEFLGQSGNNVVDARQLGAPTIDLRMIGGNSSNREASSLAIGSNVTIGKINFGGRSNGLTAVDPFYAPSSITIQSAKDRATSDNVASADFYITNTHKTSFRNGANVDGGGIPSTFIANQAGNTVIAAKSDGTISLRPQRDYGADGSTGNATYTQNRFPDELHEFHTFLSAGYLGTKTGTLVEIQSKSGETFDNTSGFNYDSKGNATLRLSTHLANSDVKAQWDITNEQSSGNLLIRDNAPGTGTKIELNASRTTLSSSLRLQNLTTTQINALSGPLAGDMVFNTTLNQVCVYNGSAWQKLTQSAM